MLRVVIDTNVLVSSLLSKRGVPARIIHAWKKGKFEVAIGEFTLTEARTTLEDLLGTGKYSITRRRINGLLKQARSAAKFVTHPPDVSGSIPADPDDEKILAIAVGGQASIIVSGDKHLLNLKEYRGVAILTPHQFLELLNQDREPETR